MGKILAPRGYEAEFLRHWYLIANRAEAVLYEGRLLNDFRILRRIENPKGRLSNLELLSDRAGRSFSSSRSGVRHGYEPKVSYHEEMARRFARRLADILDRAILAREYSDLVVMAEPHLLGLLNHYFSKRVRGIIKKEIPREWGQGSDARLQNYLKEKMANF